MRRFSAAPALFAGLVCAGLASGGADARLAPEALSAKRATAIWKEAVQEGLRNNTKKSVTLLQKLLDSSQKEIGEDLLFITAARLLYQNEAFEKAISYYKKIPRTSDYWLESLEERAWAYAKRGQYDEAKSDLQTLMAPLFAPHLGPEPYLLNSFVELKTCNYKGVFEGLKTFKDRYQKRSEALKALTQNPKTPETLKFLERLKSEPLTQTKLGADAQKLPRLAHRDQSLKEAISSGSPSAAYEKIKLLAQADLDEVSKVLKKMHVIEVEAIQRMHTAQPVEGGDLKDHEAGSNQIKFPYSGEVWLDELDHYKVSSDNCPKAKGS